MHKLLKALRWLNGKLHRGTEDSCFWSIKSSRLIIVGKILYPAMHAVENSLIYWFLMHSVLHNLKTLQEFILVRHMPLGLRKKSSRYAPVPESHRYLEYTISQSQKKCLHEGGANRTVLQQGWYKLAFQRHIIVWGRWQEKFSQPF